MKPGRRVVMMATNAFGLGVDKPDIRFVLHFHVPGSLEAYVQEAGRAGRDGKAAQCVLLWSPDDVAIQEYFQEGNYPSGKQVRQVAEALGAWTATDRAVGLRALATSSAVGEKRTRVVLDYMEENGWARQQDGKWLAVGAVPDDQLAIAGRWFELKRIEDRRRLDALVAYAESKACRVRAMLDYFGEPGPERCGRCDNCVAAAKAEAGEAPEAEVEQGEEAALEGGRRKKRRRGGRRRGRARGKAQGVAAAPQTGEAAAAAGGESAPAAAGATAAPAGQGAHPLPGEPGRRRRRRRGGRGRRGRGAGAPREGASAPAPERATGVSASPEQGGAAPVQLQTEAVARAAASEPGAFVAASGTADAAPAHGKLGGHRRRRRRRRRGGGGPPGAPPAPTPGAG
jgi:superfamily II DNA/RNA helicase